MTDDGTPEGAQGQPDPVQPDPAQPDPPRALPVGQWGTGTRVEQLATWMESIRPRFTDAAIQRSALAGGFTLEEVAEAFAIVDARGRASDDIAPVRSKARRIVLAAYGIVWLLFAIPYLGLTTSYGYGPFAQAILTVALVLGLLISVLAIRFLHPDPARTDRALVIFLVVPVVLLLGISGLCLPFVPMTSS